MSSRLSDQQLMALLEEDVPHGDLTSRNLQLTLQPCTMHFQARYAMCVSAVVEAARLLQLLDCDVQVTARSGQSLQPGDAILQARGDATRLLTGWKVAQTLIEWASGISSCAAAILAAARQVDADVVVACTRKAVPGTRRLSMQAVVDGGAQLHRTGLSETLLLFPEHRLLGLSPGPELLTEQIRQLQVRCPERKRVVEVTSVQEGLQAAAAGAEVIQAEKFNFEALAELSRALQAWPQVHLAAAGGINAGNAADYVAAGARILVTSAPYTAAPKDVAVSFVP